ncbi:hypothetical protein [Pseudomonas aeruginosa]|uniref:hypothetical protein n=1 Tax=Pseudomonas aeruginosa TaxID=287 RepID=UPI00157A6B46|nr:hypothetical protein [Pseudomonas aeruginosa]
MDSLQPHSTASKGLGFLSVALAIISRLFLVLVAYPAVGFFLLVGFASDWSFTGVGRLVTDIQYEAQQVGKAEAPGHLLAKRCTDESQAHKTLPAQVSCDAWELQEVPVEVLAKEAGRPLAMFYWVFIVVSVAVVAITSPASPLRLRERLGLQRRK